MAMFTFRTNRSSAIKCQFWVWCSFPSADISEAHIWSQVCCETWRLSSYSYICTLSDWCHWFDAVRMIKVEVLKVKHFGKSAYLPSGWEYPACLIHIHQVQVRSFAVSNFCAKLCQPAPAFSLHLFLCTVRHGWSVILSSKTVRKQISMVPSPELCCIKTRVQHFFEWHQSLTERMKTSSSLSFA